MILPILLSGVLHEAEHSHPDHQPGETFECIAIDDGLNNLTDCLLPDYTIVRLRHHDPQALRGDEIMGGVVNVVWTTDGWVAQGSAIRTIYPIRWIMHIQ